MSRFRIVVRQLNPAVQATDAYVGEDHDTRQSSLYEFCMGKSTKHLRSMYPVFIEHVNTKCRSWVSDKEVHEMSKIAKIVERIDKLKQEQASGRMVTLEDLQHIENMVAETEIVPNPAIGMTPHFYIQTLKLGVKTTSLGVHPSEFDLLKLIIKG